MTVGEAIIYMIRRHERAASAALAMALLPAAWQAPEFATPAPRLEPPPVPGPDLIVGLPVHGRITSRFGMRTLGGTRRHHDGLDIAADLGAPVTATADGTVHRVGFQHGYGLTVVVDHGNGQQTLYAHLARATVSVGTHIHRGDVLGAVGLTGHTTGPHVHYEIRKAGVAQDPQAVG